MEKADEAEARHLFPWTRPKVHHAPNPPEDNGYYGGIVHWSHGWYWSYWRLHRPGFHRPGQASDPQSCSSWFRFTMWTEPSTRLEASTRLSIWSWSTTDTLNTSCLRSPILASRAGLTWLDKHNPEIDFCAWTVKMTRCLLHCCVGCQTDCKAEEWKAKREDAKWINACWTGALFPPPPFPLGLWSDSSGLHRTHWTQPFRQPCHSNFINWTGLDRTPSPVQSSWNEH